MPFGAPEYYETLGVPRTASAGDIRKAHRKLVRRCHPELNPGDTSAEERFKIVQEAYETLIDPDARRIYDRATFKPEPRWAETPSGTERSAGPQPAAGPGSFERRPRMNWEGAGNASARYPYVPPPVNGVSGAFAAMLKFLLGCAVLVFYGAVRGLWSLALPPRLGLEGLSVLMPLWALFIVGLVCGRTRGKFLAGSTLINAAAWCSLIVYCREALSLQWADIVAMLPWVLPTHLAIVLGARVRRGTPD
jgi:hypothetical protein